jgi:hypothetical protein
MTLEGGGDHVHTALRQQVCVCVGGGCHGPGGGGRDHVHTALPQVEGVARMQCNVCACACRAKNIQNKPRINEDPKDAMLREFQARPLGRMLCGWGGGCS